MQSVSSQLLITSSGVGEIKVSKRFLSKMVPTDFSAHYFCGYVGDAVPVEGVHLYENQVRVYFSSGPFRRKALKENVLNPDPKDYAAQALKAIKKGVKVAWISVIGPVAKTEKGITVGASLSALQASYDDLEFAIVPGVEDELECVATAKSLPNVRFILDACECAQTFESFQSLRSWCSGKTGKQGGIIRIDIVSPNM